MQSHDISFRPELPASFSKSIDRLGAGGLDKLVLRFDHVFWDRDVDWFNYIAPEDLRYDWT